MKPLRLDWVSAATPGGAARFAMLDAVRGLAVIAMAIYHFSWDLGNFGYIAADVEGALPWRLIARSIAGTFLFLVGVGLVLATRRGLDWRRFARRLALVAASALAITVVTWFVFPDAFIFFGVLHHIVVASVLGLVFLRLPVALVIAGAAVSFALPQLAASPPFDAPALIWIGLGTFVPRTNDFVPLFPWFGVVLAGIAAARLWSVLASDALRARLADFVVPWPLVWAGRHSLAVYLLHQPLLFGLVALAAWIAPPDLLKLEPAYLSSCNANCAAQDVDAAACRSICGCAADRSQAEGLWDGLMRNTLTEDAQSRYFAIVDECRMQAGGFSEPDPRSDAGR